LIAQQIAQLQVMQQSAYPAVLPSYYPQAVGSGIGQPLVYNVPNVYMPHQLRIGRQFIIEGSRNAANVNTRGGPFGISGNDNVGNQNL